MTVGDNMENLTVNETAIIVGINKGNDELFDYEMREMENLACACNILPIKRFVQNLAAPLNTTYLGSGKLIELGNLAKELNPTYIILNDEVSPAQYNHITNIVEDAVVLDRTNLILRIFATRARTKEATLQVELARLEYTLPRLQGARENLSRVGGGSSGGGATNRGAGETKLELDKRYIEARILKVKEDLATCIKERSITRKARQKQDAKIVAFAGYTNAGKSSTINSLLDLTNTLSLDKKVFVKDMLFATLDTTTRRIVLSNNHDFLITDTVGFVSKLPHKLVESFKSTLEEITEASLIVHLVDASSPYLTLQMETTKEVLESIGCKDIPVVYAYNKMDLVQNEVLLPMIDGKIIKISNETKEGLDDLLDYMDKTLYPSDISCCLLIPYSKGSIYNNLVEKAHVTNTDYTNDGIKVDVTLSEYLYNLYKEYEVK